MFGRRDVQGFHDRTSLLLDQICADSDGMTLQPYSLRHTKGVDVQLKLLPGGGHHVDIGVVATDLPGMTEEELDRALDAIETMVVNSQRLGVHGKVHHKEAIEEAIKAVRAQRIAIDPAATEW